MSGKQLYEAIGLIEDELIEEADKPRRKKSAKIAWMKWASMAAGFVLICIICGTVVTREYGTKDADTDPALQDTTMEVEDGEDSGESVEDLMEESISNFEEDARGDLPDLPMLMATADLGTFGFEGYLEYDESELDRSNPWNEDMIFDSLPVYKNLSYTDAAGMPKGEAGGKNLLAKLEKAAEQVGLKTYQLTYQVYEEYEDGSMTFDSKDSVTESDLVYEVSATDGNTSIRVDEGGLVQIEFQGGFDLPDGYSMANREEDGDMALKSVEYLTEEYAELLGYESPVCSTWVQYHFDGIIDREYSVYDDAQDDLTKILNYNFSGASFYESRDDALSMITMWNRTEDAEKIADYPAITPNRAREKLLAGRYVTSVPYEIAEEENVISVELVYMTGNIHEYMMPYYKFMVETPEEKQKNGLKTYGAYYVPAINGSYIENMPTMEVN